MKKEKIELNKLCLKCERKCKQYSYQIVVRCPIRIPIKTETTLI